MIGHKEQEFEKALSFGLKALSSKSRTRHEFYSILKKKSFQESTIIQVIDHLQRLKYIDDKKVALHYAIARAKRRLWAESRIRNELRKRGVTENDIDEALSGLRGEIDEKEILEKAMTKKLAALKQMDHEKKITKLYRYLTRKGFSHRDIMDKMKNLTEKRDYEIG